jgi:hypothetical protein
MMYFKDCTTIDEVKARYKDLAKQHHPDRGGDTATMQAINAAYSIAVIQIARGENRTESEINDILTDNEQYRAAIDAVINLQGINIELVGSWIWITGNTKEHRQTLKDAGYFWASKKIAWYFRGSEYKCSSRKGKCLDEIREKYGSQTVKTAGHTTRTYYAIAS